MHSARRTARCPFVLALVLAMGCESTNPGAQGPDADAVVDPDQGADSMPSPDATPPSDADGSECTVGARCDDDDPCTADDRCDAQGACRGVPRPCADDDVCTADGCDSATGACSNTLSPRAEPEGAPGSADCSNGVDDDCDRLTDADDPDCRRCDADRDCVDGNPCTTERCDAGRCVNAIVPDESECDDANPCTVGDLCAEGTCVGTAMPCAPSPDACRSNRCDPASGECREGPGPDGAACNDGDACTSDDACLGGRCAGAVADCSGEDGACVLGVCDAATGACRAVPRSDGVPCGGDDRCVPGAVCRAGRCEGEDVDCSPLDAACSVGVCDAASGACVVEPAADGRPCDDGEACTAGDACVAGSCRGTPLDCAGAAGPCAVGECDPNRGACVETPVPNGEACDDGVGCTFGDRCQDGACTGTPLVCPPPPGACTVSACDAARGECVVLPAEDGTPCDDGASCTERDACTAGVCTGSALDCADEDACTRDACAPENGACTHALEPREGPEGRPGEPACTNGRDDDCDGAIDARDPDCRTCAEDAECDDGNPCTLEGCRESRCVPLAGSTDGLACDDADRCSEGDVCRDGRCIATPRRCDAFPSACTESVCDPASGICVPRPLADGAPCDDFDPCTNLDVCSNGQCGGRALDCSAFDGECTQGFCDPQSGLCRVKGRADGAACTDGARCTNGDRCQAGVCVGTEVDCGGEGLAACQVAVCEPGSGACIVRPAADGASCDDGDACTLGDTCAGGRCAGRPADCRALDGACVVGACNPADGACRAVPRPDATPCDDGSRCTQRDACVGGVCQGAPLDCSALGQGCRVGLCEPQSGRCVAEPAADGLPCDDAQACTAGDACRAGACVGRPVDCSASGGPCAEGACEPATGACFARRRPDGTACDDGQICTRGDVCQDGVCRGNGLDCRGFDAPCVVGQCDTDRGECTAEPVPDGDACDDANACTVADTCEAGRCGGAPRDCSALDTACLVGTCDPRTGACVARARGDGTACDDGDACTQRDQCRAGICGGIALDCSGLSSACTRGVCDRARGACVAEPLSNGTACRSGNLCQREEACVEGRCVGRPVECPAPAGAPCQVATCDPANGQCRARAAEDGTRCDDGAYCTTPDVCRAGRCAPGPGRDCNPPGEPCRVGQCNEDNDRCDIRDAPQNQACDDGQFCTLGDRCRSGVCRPVEARVCPSGNGGCLVGVCDEGQDLCRQEGAPDNRLCDDGRRCTIGDYCRAAQCVPFVNACQ